MKLASLLGSAVLVASVFSAPALAVDENNCLSPEDLSFLEAGYQLEDMSRRDSFMLDGVQLWDGDPRSSFGVMPGRGGELGRTRVLYLNNTRNTRACRELREEVAEMRAAAEAAAAVEAEAEAVEVVIETEEIVEVEVVSVVEE